jgi:hypothetical protein
MPNKQNCVTTTKIPRGAFVGDKNFSVIKMHGTTIKTDIVSLLPAY